MKKILTIITTGNVPAENSESYEVINAEECKNELSDAVKQAKGKYVLLTDDAICIPDDEALFEELEKSSYDAIYINGGCFVKTAIVKSLKNCNNIFSMELYSLFSAKNAEKLPTIATVTRERMLYSEENKKIFSEVLDEFLKSKAKISKEVYSVAADIILSSLLPFYASAILLIKDKKLQADKLCEFDLKLKENMVLYLSLEKKFSAGNLSKLRENNFKAGFITCQKLKKQLK